MPNEANLMRVFPKTFPGVDFNQHLFGVDDPHEIDKLVVVFFELHRLANELGRFKLISGQNPKMDSRLLNVLNCTGHAVLQEILHSSQSWG